jgi:5-methylcytosine-specific restriction endonuclease McrA
MTWTNGGPGNRIPRRVRRAVYVRQHGRCNVYDPSVCSGSLDEYDHIVNTAVSGIPRSQCSANDVQGLCSPCHNAKTQVEARHGKRAKRYRPPLLHPGLA